MSTQQYRKLRFHMMKSSIVGNNVFIINDTIERVRNLHNVYYKTAKALDYANVDEHEAELVLGSIRESIRNIQLRGVDDAYTKAVGRLYDEAMKMLIEAEMNVVSFHDDIVYVRHVNDVGLVEINHKLYKKFGTFLERFQ